jgi:hypothetical protein
VSSPACPQEGRSCSQLGCGKPLRDDRTLAEQGIVAGTTIKVVPEHKGGVGGKKGKKKTSKGVDTSDDSSSSDSDSDTDLSTYTDPIKYAAKQPSWARDLNSAQKQAETPLGKIYWQLLQNPLSSDTYSARHDAVYEAAKSRLRNPTNLQVSRRLIAYIYQQIDRRWFEGQISPYLIKRYGRDLEIFDYQNRWLSETASHRSGIYRFEKRASLHVNVAVLAARSDGLDSLTRLIKTIEEELCGLLVTSFQGPPDPKYIGKGKVLSTFLSNTFGGKSPTAVDRITHRQDEEKRFGNLQKKRGGAI